MDVATHTFDINAMVGMITLIVGIIKAVGTPTNVMKTVPQLLSAVLILVEDTTILEQILAGVIPFLCTGNAILIARHVLPLTVGIAAPVAILHKRNGKGLIDAVRPIVLVEELDMV